MVRKFWTRLSFRLVVVCAIIALALPVAALAQTLFQAGLEYDANGNPTHLVVTVKNNETTEIYIGASIYKKGITDPLVQGVHSYATVGPGESVTKKYTLKDANGDAILAGTYEVALWGKKIPKEQAADPNYYFCKKWGFVFDQEKAYTSGWVMGLNATK